MGTKFTLIYPSLIPLTCNLLKSGRHVTSPNQGLSSTTPSCGKTKDPGNEVEAASVRISRIICVISLPKETLKNFNTKLARRAKQSKTKRFCCLSINVCLPCNFISTVFLFYRVLVFVVRKLRQGLRSSFS